MAKKVKAAKKKVAKKQEKKQKDKKQTKKQKKEAKKNNMSHSVSQKVLQLLMDEGQMSADKIAKKIGRSKVFVNKVINGEATLSAEELGKLTKAVGSSLGSSLIKKISDITMDDVKEAAEKAKSAAAKAVKGTPDFTSDVLKKALKEAGNVIQSAGSFLKGLGS
ncbi:MAG: helix-turn-helix transcriptional regulator [Sedimentisphaerales bacterium]|nr:helix-turn-helix transcriptional regulator [Sedimentisphaerales bacterium]